MIKWALMTLCSMKYSYSKTSLIVTNKNIQERKIIQII